MIRRRRPPREIAFSFDSFLDVVANVVGIILRLILVAWVGARSCRAFAGPPPPPPAPVEEEVAGPPERTDPLTAEIPRRQRELDEAEANLQEKLRAAEEVRKQETAVAADLTGVQKRLKQLEA